MKDLQYNGYIIQRKPISNYCGIDGDNWYLNYCSDKSYFENYFDENIEKAWANLNFVDCCVDNEYMRYCIEESLKLGIEFRVLLCSTSKKAPRLEKIELGQVGNILGYDYAYSGGSYYSCILNDIISGRIKEFSKFHLNENGLFDSYEEVEKFILCREKMKDKNSDYVFEDGDFIIYKITEINIEVSGISENARNRVRNILDNMD